MNLGPNHYVPVLKVKRGEKGALERIFFGLRSRIVPLLEIVEWRKDRKRTLSEHLDTTFNALADSLRLYPACFLDARELVRQGPAAADEVFCRARDAGISFVPVTGISRLADVSAALGYQERGLAIRLSREEFEGGDLQYRLRDFLNRHEIHAEKADLIVDLGAVEEMIVEGIAAFATQFLLEIPEPDSWRTLTLSLSAFPKSMGTVERKSHGFVERADWAAWRDHLFYRGDDVPRIPTYSDCAIQHPAGVEGFDPRLMPVSASIRYTLPDNWLLIKGESTRRRSAREQFPELAKQLVYGHLHSHFAKVDHCHGCAAIKRAADGEAGLGSAETWRRIGSVHHVTEVMQALSSLNGS